MDAALDRLVRQQAGSLRMVPSAAGHYGFPGGLGHRVRLTIAQREEPQHELHPSC